MAKSTEDELVEVEIVTYEDENGTPRPQDVPGDRRVIGQVAVFNLASRARAELVPIAPRTIQELAPHQFKVEIACRRREARAESHPRFERPVAYPIPDKPTAITPEHRERLSRTLIASGISAPDIAAMEQEIGWALAHYSVLRERIDSKDAPLELLPKNEAIKQVKRFAAEARRFAALVKSLQPELSSRILDEIGNSGALTGTGSALEIAKWAGDESEIADRFSAAHLDWEAIADAADAAIVRLRVESRGRIAGDPAADDLGAQCVSIWKRHTGQDAKRGSTNPSPFEDFLGLVLDLAGVEIAPESLSKRIFRANPPGGR